MGVGGQNGSMAPAAISDWRKNGPNVHDIVKEQGKSITDDLKEQSFLDPNVRFTPSHLRVKPIFLATILFLGIKSSNLQSVFPLCRNVLLRIPALVARPARAVGSCSISQSAGGISKKHHRQNLATKRKKTLYISLYVDPLTIFIFNG